MQKKLRIIAQKTSCTKRVSVSSHSLTSASAQYFCCVNQNLTDALQIFRLYATIVDLHTHTAI